MTNETLEFPVLDGAQQPAPAAPAVAATPVSTITKDRPLVIANVKDAAVDQLRAKEPDLLALAERYRAVVYDLNTPKGLAEAKAARHDLRENGRFLIQNGRDNVKKVLNGAKPAVEAEAERLIAITKPTEDLLHTQIEAREQVLADEKAERDRVEAERIATHQAGLDSIRALVAKAKGIESARIANGIKMVEAMEIDPAAWEEFADQALAAKAEVLATMRAMFDRTLAHEQELAKIEAQRVENERIAAEQAAEAKRLKEVADALAAEQKAAADKLAADRADFERQRAEFEAKQTQAAAPAPAPAPVATITEQAAPVEAVAEPVAEVVVPVEAVQPAPAAQPTLAVVQQIPASTLQQPAANADTEQPQIKLGDINARIAPLSISADGLAQLGFTALPVKGAARMYLQSDLPKMIAAMVKNLTTERQLLAA